MKKRTVVLAGILTTAGVCGAGYGGYRYFRNNTGGVEVYSVASLNVGSYDYGSTTYGTTTANAAQNVYLDSSQSVSEVMVSEGDRVSIGDVLMTYDSTLLELDLEAAQLSYQSIQLDLLTAKKELDELNKITPVADSASAGGADDLDSAALASNEVTMRAAAEETETPSAESAAEETVAAVEETMAATAETEAPTVAAAEETVAAAETEAPAVAAAEETVAAAAETEVPTETQTSTEAPTEVPTEAQTSTEAPTETDPIEEVDPSQTESQAPATETQKQTETETETEPETSPMAEAKVYKKLNYKSKPYKGDGTKEDPYVFYCKDGCVVKASFMNKVLGFTADGTTKEEGGFNKDGEGCYVILEIREGDDISGGFLKGVKINGTRKNDTAYDPSVSWTFTCDGLERETEEITEPDTETETEPEYPDDWDDGGWDDGGDSYTVSELKEAIANKKSEIYQLELDLRSAELTVTQAQRKVNDASVTATINGVVKSVGAADGDDSSAYITVTSDSGMYVSGSISELDLETVTVGSTITGYTYDSFTYFDAEITEVSDYPNTTNDYYYYDGTTNPNVSYYTFLAYIDDAEGISNNEFAELTIQQAVSDEDVIYIEKKYVRSENGQSYVYKVGEDGRLTKQYVKTGEVLWSYYVEIKDGLTQDDYICFPYGNKVYEGAPVKSDDEDDGDAYEDLGNETDTEGFEGLSDFGNYSDYADYSDYSDYTDEDGFADDGGDALTMDVAE